MQKQVATELLNYLNCNQLSKMQKNTQLHIRNFRDNSILHSEHFASLDMIFMLIEFIIESLLLMIKCSDWFFSWYDNLQGNQMLFFDWEFMILEFIMPDCIFNVQITSEIVNTSLIEHLKKNFKTVNINSFFEELWARYWLNDLFSIRHVSIWLISIDNRSNCSKSCIDKLILSSQLRHIWGIWYMCELKSL